MTAIDWGDPLNTGLPNFLRREESPAPTAADPTPADATTEPEAIEKAETESLRAEPVTERRRSGAGWLPEDDARIFILLQHLGVELTKHRDSTITGSFKRCSVVLPSFRCKVEKTTLLELLCHCWEGDSRRDDFPEDSKDDEAEFRTWFNEQYTLMDAARFAKPGEAAAGAPEPAAEPETSTEEARGKPAGQQITRPLTDLVRLIKKELRLGKEAAAPHWLEVGKLLHEAKAQLDHGIFGSWCKEHFGISATQRARYMKAAESAVQNFRAGKYEDASLEDHLRGTSYETKPRAQQSAINSEALREDALNRAEERDLRRKLMLKLIDRGYKSLAAELHPDKGGSTEAMTRLNEVRDAVKRCTAGIGVL